MGSASKRLSADIPLLRPVTLWHIYRNSYKKNICVDMLRDGYHKSFTELFSLMEKWDALREAARVRSLLWVQRPLEEQPDKLDHFYYYLTRAEAAERKEYFEDVYNNLYALACYFNNSEDKWVRNHFYERCLKIAQLIKIDGGKKEAEAHAHMGLLFEEEDKTHIWRPHSNSQAAAVSGAGGSILVPGMSIQVKVGYQPADDKGQAVVQGMAPAPSGNCRANEHEQKP
ncbi:hypothetical protein CB1_000961028 [Camelus ferus]|nr:hypothetical protein CB1_000961028 [Camelus ferus]